MQIYQDQVSKQIYIIGYCIVIVVYSVSDGCIPSVFGDLMCSPVSLSMYYFVGMSNTGHFSVFQSQCGATASSNKYKRFGKPMMLFQLCCSTPGSIPKFSTMRESAVCILKISILIYRAFLLVIRVWVNKFGVYKGTFLQ